MMRYLLPSILTALTGMLLTCSPIRTDPTSLEGEWRFRPDPDGAGIDLGWFGNDADIDAWQPAQVPGFWPDEDYDGYGWYVRDFSVQALPGGYRMALRFMGVDDNAKVWLNGNLLGDHSGYDQIFYFDVTDKLTLTRTNRLAVRIEDLGGPGGIHKGVELVPYREAIDLIATPESKLRMPPAAAWAQNAAFYEIFVRDYSAAGTFQGVTDDMDRIQALGVDVLWLMPVHPIGEVNRKGALGSPYAVQDFYAINPDMGTFDDLRELVKEAHSRGMRVILDFVLNHSAWDNPLILEHPDWYLQNAQGEIISRNSDWWDIASFDYSRPELRAYMIDLLTWWLQETGIDGYRFDVAELFPLDFWRQARQACQEIRPDVFFLAEGKQPALHLNGMDMTYSWNVWETLGAVCRGEMPVSQLRQTIAAEAQQYPANALRLRFTENHDKPRSRIFVGDRTTNRTAWVFAALMKGNPLIYAGQERGARHQPSLFEREPLDWERGDRLLERRMGEILGIRKNSLKPGAPFEIVLGDDKHGVIAYRHGPLLAFFNFSSEPFNFSASGIDSLLSGGVEQISETEFRLPPGEYGVFE